MARLGRGRGRGTSFPTLRSDLAIKGTQMRRGSLAKLAIPENFGKLSVSPLRVGKIRLCGFNTATG